MGRYFGTDGIRGTFGGALLNVNFAHRVGLALAAYLRQQHGQKPLTVAIGRDTRASGVDLEAALSQGFCLHEVNVIHLGVIPTPGIALAVQQLHADLGVALTASHNPATDNGIKLFSPQGHKLAPQTEATLEALIDAQPSHPTSASTCGFFHDGREHYINYLRSLLDCESLRDWPIVLDCANGATAQTSPLVLRHFGAKLTVIGDRPDGQNINQGIGSEHPEALQAAVRNTGARLGIAHDGDGDRCVLVDELGQVVHGDQLLGLLALHEIRRRQLAKDTLVTTIQSNVGLDHCLQAAGARVIRTDVGDRNVLLALLAGGYSLGGESSGHLIFPQLLETGDGLIAALKTLEVMLATRRPLSALAAEVTLFPQRSIALAVQQKTPLADCPHLQATLGQLDRQWGATGRHLVRYSGTEPKIRLLVEAQDASSLDPALAALRNALTLDGILCPP